MRVGIKEKDIRDLEKYANKLYETMTRIIEYNPKASIYMNMECLELFGDDVYNSFEDYLEENQVASVWIPHASGGAYK